MISESEILKMVKINGKSVALYQNHTFSFVGPKNSRRYLSCSKKQTAKCPARLKLDGVGNIVAAIAEHTHPPVQIFQTSNGSYVRL